MIFLFELGLFVENVKNQLKPSLLKQIEPQIQVNRLRFPHPISILNITFCYNFVHKVILYVIICDIKYIFVLVFCTIIHVNCNFPQDNEIPW